MAITVTSNFKGPRFLTLDDRAFVNTKDEAMTILNTRGANGLIVTILNEETGELDEDGNKLYRENPKTYRVYMNMAEQRWDLHLLLDESNIGETGGTLPIDRYTYSGIAGKNLVGIEAGESFSEITLDEFAERLLNQDENPTLTDPSCTINVQNIDSNIEIHSRVSPQVSATFSRGLISPQYTAENGFRSGLPVAYNFTGPGIATPRIESTELSALATVSLIDTSSEGSLIWTSNTEYSEGVQPKTKQGKDYLSPLSAGTTKNSTYTTNIVFPYFATTSLSYDFVKQSLTTSKEYTINAVSELAAPLEFKQGISIVESKTLKEIRFYNTQTKNWDLLGGSVSAGLSYFNKTTVERDINGIMYNYINYTFNGAKIGARQLRFTLN